MSTLKLEKIESLQGTGNTVITFDSSDRAVFAQPPLTAVPAFHVKKELVNQTVTTNTLTKVTMDATPVFDTNSWWDSTNHRYTPQIAGYYSISSGLGAQQTTATNAGRVIALLYKNGDSGTLVGRHGYSAFYSNSSAQATGSSMVYLNGSTDYVELWAYITGAGTINIWGSTSAGYTFLTGFLVRAGAE